MKRRDLIVSVIILALAITFTIVNFVRAAEPFDHSWCKYPLRASNPPDGCDNSDYTDPNCVEFTGQNACVPIYHEKTDLRGLETVVLPLDPEITTDQPVFEGK